jgi:hypothetical protein
MISRYCHSPATYHLDEQGDDVLLNCQISLALWTMLAPTMEGKTTISDKRAVEAIYPLLGNDKIELTPPRAQSGVTVTESDGNPREEKEVDCNEWCWRSYR